MEEQSRHTRGSWRVRLRAAKYGKATLSGSLSKDRGDGMEAGIAMKSGNADGVKASTAINRGWANILHTQRWVEDGK